MLLAFAFFPAGALAEDSSELEYGEAVPSVPGKTHDKNPAKSSGSGAGSGKSSTDSGSSSETGTSGDDSSDDKGAAAPNRDGGSGKGSQDKGAAADDRSRVAANPPAGETETAPISHDDSSSPLVPILIALAVLAAISIGVVVMRRRSQGQDPHTGSSASPEAS